jgi:hypothetical protein
MQASNFSNAGFDLMRTQFVIARSEATWQSRWWRDDSYGNQIATLRSQ